MKIFTRKFWEFDVTALLERRPLRGSGLIVPVPVTMGGVGIVMLIVILCWLLLIFQGCQLVAQLKIFALDSPEGLFNRMIFVCCKGEQRWWT